MIIDKADWVYFDPTHVNDLDSTNNYEGMTNKINAVISAVEWCELIERGLRRVDLPKINIWNALGKQDTAYSDSSPSHCFRGGVKYPLRIPIALGREEIVLLWGLFGVMFENSFLDPDAPIIRNGNISLGYGDSTLCSGKIRTPTGDKSIIMSVQKHTVGSHIFTSISDWVTDTELKTVTIPGFEEPIRMSAHGMGYHPVGSDNIDILPSESSSSSPVNDRYNRKYGRYETEGYRDPGSDTADVPYYKYHMAMLDVYPDLEYKGGDPENPPAIPSQSTDPDGYYSSQKDKFCDVEWNASNGSEVGMRVATSSYQTRIYLFPKISYTWNYWFEKNLLPTTSGAWGTMPGADGLRLIFTPPLLEGLVPYLRSGFTDYSDREADKTIFAGYPLTTAYMTGLADYLRYMAESGWESEYWTHMAAAVTSPTCPNIRIPGLRSVPINTSSGYAYVDNGSWGGIWCPPVMWMTVFKSFSGWLDRFRYTLYQLDVDDIWYKIDASISNTSTAGEIGKSGEYEGSIDWEGAGTPNGGVGSHLKGLDISLSRMSLPSTQDGEFTATTHYDENEHAIPHYSGHIDQETGKVVLDSTTPVGTDASYTHETTEKVKVSVKISKITPLKYSTSRNRFAKGGTASYDTDEWNTSNPSSPHTTNHQEASDSGGAHDEPSPLLTRGIMRQMNSCKLYAIFRVKIEDVYNNGHRYEFASTAGDWAYTRSDYGSNGDEWAHFGIQAYRLVCLGEPNEDGSFGSEDFNPYSLVSSVMEGLSLQTFEQVEEVKDYLMPSNMWKGWSADRYPTYSGDVNNSPQNYFKKRSVRGRAVDLPWERSRYEYNGDEVLVYNHSQLTNTIEVSMERAFLVIDWNFDRGGDSSSLP